MRIIFLEKSYSKCGGVTSPRPFSGKLKLRIFLDQWSKVLYSLFLLYSKFPCLIFSIIFEWKYFSCYILLIDQVSLSGCFYFVRYWAICVLQLFVSQVVTPWILKLTLIYQAVFSTWPKSHDKNLNTLRTKRAFTMK